MNAKVTSLSAAWLAVCASLATAALAVAGEAELPTPAQLWEKCYQSTGNAQTLKQVKTAVIKTLVTERDREIPVEFKYKAPDMARFGLSVSGMIVAVGHPGKGLWWRQEMDQVMDFSGPRASAMWELVFGLALPAWVEFAQVFPQARVEEKRAEGGRECYYLAASNTFGCSIRLGFDAASGALVQIGKGKVTKYGEFAGLKIPAILEGEGLGKVQVQEVKLNEPMADAEFAKPSGLPVMNEENSYQTLLSPSNTLAIVRQPAPANFGRKKIDKLPKYNPDSSNPFQLDLRGTDASGLDMAALRTNVWHADFDDKTTWPATLPPGYSPRELMTVGKNPGLQVRALHQRGITGKGVGLAIIDKTLLVDHQEYKDRLKLYEEIHNFLMPPMADMHGAAVASIAVGKTVGVAPEADLYYIAETHGVFGQGKFDWDFNWVAKSIDRIIAVNRTLPRDRKIRVISISVGWSPGQKGFEETNAAVERAAKEGIFVISTAIESTHKLAFHGLGRAPLKDPELAESYEPGSWWAKSYFTGRWGDKPRLMVPMDSRCTASPTGRSDYVFYTDGGWSWSVPYLAGLYALACQINPEVTPASFWEAGLETGKKVAIEHQGKTYQLGPIVDPAALLAKIKKD